MAKGGKDEHRMLFDIRGKRRNVVKVVYGVLALLMGLSLLLVAGPLPFGDIFGAKDATEEAREQFEDQAKRIEVKLAKDPQNPDLLLNLTRAHVSAGSSLAETNPETGEIALTVDSREQYEQASSVWSEYLEATEKPSAGAAQLMSNTLVSLAEVSAGSEGVANMAAAAEAQKIVADQRPSINSLSTLALYTLYTFDYAKAERVLEEAKKLATSKVQREQLDQQFEEVRKIAKRVQKGLAAEKSFEKAAQEGKGGAQSGGGGQPLGSPFGSGVGGTTLNE